MIIAIDTGGTKTLVARFSKRGTLEKHIKFPTPTDQLEYLEQLVHFIGKLTDKKPPECISVALPDIGEGSFVAQFSNLPWKNFDVVAELSPLFPDTKVIAGNDAKLGGLGEVRSMNPLPARALYVTISTGIGTGFIKNGNIDKTLAVAEGGHMVLEFDGALQEWEHFASGKAIFTIYKKYGSEITSKRTWRQITDRFSRGFLALIPLLRPEVIIIGGSMGTHFEKYGELLTGMIEERLPVTVKRPKIIQAKHPEEAVIYGCYYHAIDNLSH